MKRTVHLLLFGGLSQRPDILKGVMNYVREHSPAWNLQMDIYGIPGISWKLNIPEHDAVLAIIAGPVARRKVERLRCQKVVISFNGESRATSINGDHEQIALDAIAHLQERGYRSLVNFVAGDLTASLLMTEAILRKYPQVQAFTEGPRLKAATGKWSMEKQIKDLGDLLKNSPKPVGLFCPNLEHGSRAIKAIEWAGLKCPSQVGIIVSDTRSEMCSLLHPPLSQVSHPDRDIGYESAKLLDDLLRGRVEAGTKRTMPKPKLLIRESSSVWVSTSSLLHRMQQVLVDHWELNRSPETIAKTLGVTRRTLDRHCHQEFGLSLSGQLERMRVERTRVALVSSEESLVSIALEMGYSSQSHMTAAIKKATGMTPGAYRKQG